jgi:hypothetical protein
MYVRTYVRTSTFLRDCLTHVRAIASLCICMLDGTPGAHEGARLHLRTSLQLYVRIMRERVFFIRTYVRT